MFFAFGCLFVGPCVICWLLITLLLKHLRFCEFRRVSLFLQLGYTKKQEERNFRGVITLEVCAGYLFHRIYVHFNSIPCKQKLIIFGLSII